MALVVSRITRKTRAETDDPSLVTNCPYWSRRMWPKEGCMKLFIGKPDETTVMLAEQVNGVWQANPNLTADMTKFLQGADPEQFDMWVEEPE
jgi:hypothetical protein